MKKQILLFAILVVSLTCFACSQTPAPTVTPSTEQSVEQSISPTLAPSEEVTPTIAPSVEPSETPTTEPTVAPSEEPTPSVEVSVEPSIVPTVTPTVAPTLTPTVQPTVTPSEPPAEPTVAPSVEDPSDIYFDRPADTNLEFWITENVDDVDFSSYEFGKPDFVVLRYCGTGYTADMEEKVVYGVTCYPDHADRDPYITEIEITDSNATIYGLTLNSDWETVKQVLTENEFSIIEKETIIIAQKGRLTIYFEENRILMFVEVTNNQGIIF